MPDTRQAQKNAVPNQSDGNVEEAFRRLTINENQDGGGVAQSNPYPDRPGEPDCIYYLRTGMCGYGSNCRFNHPKYASQGAQFSGELPERVGQPDCGQPSPASNVGCRRMVLALASKSHRPRLQPPNWSQSLSLFFMSLSPNVEEKPN